MSEIICIECKNAVSDESGFCPECGYPFESGIQDTENIKVTDKPVDNNINGEFYSQAAFNTVSPDLFQQALDSINLNITRLQSSIENAAQNFDSITSKLTENNQKTLSEINLKLDEVVAFKLKMETEAQAVSGKDGLKDLLKTAFNKILNSPGSMFEYMFYMAIIQIIFVVVNLFLVAYIVTLVR
ncbi:MAG: hypothetical protein PHN84_09705 [Desulfuromonadaceae bacterium]|nr:hypothetical protein [Desulfuromonadaceae bacterium]MDD2853908.1 hypothetical protein [Desulfuromonadaceae bacterium]